MDPIATVGGASLYGADVVEFLRDYDGRPFDVTVTSPPYALGKEYEEVEAGWAWDDYTDWLELWGRCLLDRTADHGRLLLNVPIDTYRSGHIPFAAEALASMVAAGWEYQSTIIWDKGVTSNSTAYGSWLSASSPTIIVPAEAVLVLSKGDWTRGKRGRTTDITRPQFMEWRSSVWSFPGASASKAGHPAPFPTQLAERLLRLFAFREDLILDPFVGSGTTCAVAEMLGRASVGVDRDSDYLTKLAVPRIRAALDLRAGAVVDVAGTRWENLALPTETDTAAVPIELVAATDPTGLVAAP